MFGSYPSIQSSLHVSLFSDLMVLRAVCPNRPLKVTLISLLKK